MQLIAPYFPKIYQRKPSAIGMVVVCRPPFNLVLRSLFTFQQIILPPFHPLEISWKLNQDRVAACKCFIVKEKWSQLNWFPGIDERLSPLNNFVDSTSPTCISQEVLRMTYHKKSNQLQKHHSCCRRSGGGALHCKWERKEFVGGARLLGAQEWRWTGGVLRKLMASRKWSTRSAKDQSFFPIIVHDRFERWLCAYSRPGYGVHLNSDNLHFAAFLFDSFNLG